MKYGIDLPNMAAASDPRLLAEIAREAEEAGWDGVFIFDTLYSPDWGSASEDRPGPPPTADPWITLAAMAMRTERVRLGTMITPLTRRRPWKVARETATLDHLSNGRLVLPVGLGFMEDGGFANVNEERDRKVRAERLDEGLEILNGLWSGEPYSFSGKHYQVDEMTFLPKPVQQPRIPVWVVGAWPRMKSMRRALRWDGVLPATTSPDGQVAPEEAARRIAEDGAYTGITTQEVAEVNEYVRRERGDSTDFDVVIEGNSSASRKEQAASKIAEYAEAGATWWLEAVFAWLALPPRDVDAMRNRIRRGPPRVG